MNYYSPVPMKNKKFEAGHLEASKELFSLNHPNYTDNLLKGLKHLRREIRKLHESEIDASDITNTGYSGGLTQSARANGRGKNADEVETSIEELGYKLEYMPISVVMCPDNKPHACDGRTRLEKLKAAGFENAIVDVFETDSWLTFHAHSVKSNPKRDPASEQMMFDLETIATRACRNGDISQTYDDIMDLLKSMGGNSFKKPTYDEMTNRVLSEYDRDLHLVAFTPSIAKKWLEKNGYINNIDNNGIYYFPYACSSPVKIFSSVANYYIELLNDSKSVKEIRIILHTSTLDGKNGEQSWKDRLDLCRKKYTDNFADIEKCHFSLNKKDGDKRNNVVKLYGAFPAVTSIASEWPLDKLVLFNKGILKNKTFQEISVKNSLNNFFEAA